MLANFTLQAEKQESLEQAREEKLIRLQGSGLNQGASLGDSYSILNGNMDSNRDKIHNDFNSAELQYLLGYANNKYGSDIQDATENRRLYLYDTKTGDSKAGVSTGGADTSDVRYDNTLDPRYNQDWRTSGESGPDLNKKRLDLNMDYGASTAMEALWHGNSGNLTERKYPNVLADEAIKAGSGVSEYYNGDGANFLGDSSYINLSPERVKQLEKQFDDYVKTINAQKDAANYGQGPSLDRLYADAGGELNRAGESIDLMKSQALKMYADLSDTARSGLRSLLGNVGVSEESLDKYLPTNAELIGTGQKVQSIRNSTELRDKMAGFDTRKAWDEEKAKFQKEVGDGKYASAAWNVVTNFDRYLAESAPEMAVMMVPYAGIPAVAASRLNNQMEEFEKTNKRSMTTEEAVHSLSTIVPLLYAEKVLFKTGATHAIDNIAKGNLGKAGVGVLASSTGEAVQEAGENIQEQWSTGEAEDRDSLTKLGEYATSDETIGGAIAGGIMGGGLRAGAETGALALNKMDDTVLDGVKSKISDKLQARADRIRTEQEIETKNQEYTKPYTDKFQSIKDTGDKDLVTSINDLIYLSQDLDVEGNTKLRKEVETYKNSLVEKLASQVADENSFKFGSSEEALVAMENIYDTATKSNTMTPELESNLNTIAKQYKLEDQLAKIKNRGQVEEQATVSDIGYISYGNQLKKLVEQPEENKNKINKYVKKLENFLQTQENKESKISSILKQAEVQFENTEANVLKFPEYQVRINPVTGKGKPLEINRQDYLKYKQGEVTGYWKILEDTKRNIDGIKQQLNIPGVAESIEVAREDIEVVAPLTSSKNVNNYRLQQQTRFKNNKVNKLIATGSRTGAEYVSVNEDIANTGSYKKDDTVAVIFDKPVENLVYYKKNGKALSKDASVAKAGTEILKAIKAGATVITDIKSHRTSKKNSHRDLLSKFMIDSGYRETKVGNGIWKPASEIKAEPKEETTKTPKPTTTNPETKDTKEDNDDLFDVGNTDTEVNTKELLYKLMDIRQEIKAHKLKEINFDNEAEVEAHEKELQNLMAIQKELEFRINKSNGNVNKPSNTTKSKPKDEAYVKQVQAIHSKLQEVKKKLKEAEQEGKDTTDLEVEYTNIDNELTSILNGQEVSLTDSISEGVEVTVANVNKEEEPVKYVTSASRILKQSTKTLVNSLHISAFNEKIGKYTDKIIKGLSNILAPVNNEMTKYGNKSVSKEHYNLLDSPARGLIFDREGNIKENVALAIGASIQDLITNSGSLLKLKNRDEVMRMLDKIYLTQEEYNFFKDKGMFLKVVADDLSSSIMKQLGVSFNKDIPAELEAKFKADLGNIAINLAQELGYVQINQVSLTELAKGLSKESEYGIYNDNSNNNNILVSFVTLGNKKLEDGLFETMEDELNVTSDFNRYPHSKPVKNSKYTNSVRNNPYNTLAKEVKDALEVQRNTKFVTRPKSINWLNENRDLALKLLGYLTVDDMATLSKVDRETAEAKNESIIRSLDALRDNKLSEMYFDFFYTKNNRYILDSTTINPQTDKQLHRWLVVPEGHIGKYSKNDPKDKELLAVTIAQAMGMGIDKKVTSEIIEFGSKLLDLDPANVKLLRDGLNKGDLSKFIEKTDLHVEIEHLGHFLEAVDVLEMWTDKSTTEIETSISAEFDGLTNGFAIRLMQMPIIKDIYKWLQKVGVFEASNDNRTMNNVLGDKSVPFLDSYQTLADKIVKSNVNDVLADLSKNTPTAITQKQAEGIINSLPIKDISGVITKELRDLFKNPFMVFNYASSINSIKKNMGYVLRDKLLADIAKGKRLELANALGITAKMVQTKYPEEIKLKTGLTLDLTIRQIIETSYGNQVGNILTDFFGEYLEANEIINNSFRGMFLVFQDAYQKATKDRILTSQEKLDEVIKLIDLLPGIKGVLSKDIREGIAIYETKGISPTDLKLGKAQTKLKDKNGKVITKAVQGLLKELDMPVNAGAVIPIHSIDGSIMTELLNSMKDIVGIHDAIIPSLRNSSEAIKKYNESFYELNKKYSIIQELVNQMNKAQEYMKANNIDPLVNKSNPKAAIKLSQVIEQLQELNERNNQAREELYSKDLSIGQMVGVDNESLFTTGSSNAISPVEVEKQYNLFSSEHGSIYSSADIRIEDTKLQEMILNGTTSNTILNYLSTSEDPFIADQAKRLLELSNLYRGSQQVRVSRDLYPKMNEGVAAYSLDNDLIIYKDASTMSKPLIFLHEFTHGLSAHAIAFMEHVIKNETPANKAKVDMYKDMLKDLDTVLTNQKRITNGDKTYAFVNRAELLAEFLANPLFRARLKQLPNIDGKSMFERILRGIGRIFGIKQEMLFDLLDRAQDDIFRVNYEVFKNNDQFRDEINLLLTKPEGYTILDKILNKMREC